MAQGSTVPHAPGDVIGARYEVIRVLGRGGFGVVYQVRARHDGLEYALKTFLRGGADPKAVARFRQEAQVWIALGRHPNLVQAHFVDEIEGRLYVGMELVRPGPSGLNALDGYFEKSPPDLRQALVWAIQLCHGMEYALSRGIRSHRDLKPANVMISPGGDVKISDFGLAALPGDSGQYGVDVTEAAARGGGFHGQTVRGMGFGTPTHMPPEQFEDAGSADERTDIYATGVILFQAATGTLPVSVPAQRGDSLEARFRFWKAMAEAHRRFELRRIDHPLEPVLRRCLVADPSGRYPTFSALRGDLEALLARTSGDRVPAPVPIRTGTIEYINRGISLERIGRHADALAAFDLALAEDSSSAAAWNGRGICLSHLGRMEEALDAFARVVELEPGHGRAHANRGNCLQALGRESEALEAYDRALELDEGVASTWSNRGNLLFRMRDRRGAVESYDRALALEPSRRGTLSNRGRVLASGGDFARALLSFEEALRSDERFLPALRGKAACSVHLGNYRTALALYERLEAEGPPAPEDWLARGMACLRLERYVETARALGRALELTESRPRALLGMAILHFRMRRFGEALVVAREAIEQGEDSRAARRLLALVLHADGRYADAVDLGRGLHDADEGDSVVACNLVCSLLRLGDAEEAVRIADRAAWALPEGDPREDAAALGYDRAFALSLVGRVEEAEAGLERVVRLDPHWDDAWFSLGGLRYERGRTRAALEACETAARLERDHAAWWKRSTAWTPEMPRRLPDGLLPVDAAGTLRRLEERFDPSRGDRLLRPPCLLEPGFLPNLFLD